MSDLLIFVPARGGSKRLPGKNLRRLAGKPLLDYTAQAIVEADLSKALCLLSTDDQNIADHGLALGWTVPWLRPPEISGDEAPTVDAVLHGLDWVKETRGGDAELVLVLQPTSPLRGGQCLVQALQLLQSRTNVSAVVGMKRCRPRAVSDRTAHIYSVDADGFIRTNLDEGEIVPNGAVYAIRATVLRDHGSLFPPHTMPLVMDEIASIDIDTEDDWLNAESSIARLQGRNHLTNVRP